MKQAIALAGGGTKGAYQVGAWHVHRLGHGGADGAGRF